MRRFIIISITLVVLSSPLSLVFIPKVNSQAREETALPLSPLPLSDSQKAEILETYAPKVWLAEDEVFWPSPVEFSFQHNRRIYGIWEPEDDAFWWLYTYENMTYPTSVLDYFHGCDGDPCKLSDVPVYAFWNEVTLLGGELTEDVVDLIYWFWFPYNRGKFIPMVDHNYQHVGNHVGDWEHISIRLLPEWDEEAGEWIYTPYQIYFSRHTQELSKLYSWYDLDVEKDTTHPIVYAAWGSHGFWEGIDCYVYKSIDIGIYIIDLKDCTSQGTAWETWQYIEAYDYDNKTGLNGNPWPTWMSRDNDDPHLGYTDPASGPIYRWGNDRWDEVLFTGQYYREEGPTGPINKPVWDVIELR